MLWLVSVFLPAPQLHAIFFCCTELFKCFKAVKLGLKIALYLSGALELKHTY